MFTNTVDRASTGYVDIYRIYAHSPPKNLIRRRLFLEFRSKSLAASTSTLVNVSASSEGSGESVHCAGSTEPSSFVNLIKLHQIFMQ